MKDTLESYGLRINFHRMEPKVITHNLNTTTVTTECFDAKGEHVFVSGRPRVLNENQVELLDHEGVHHVEIRYTVDGQDLTWLSDEL